MNAILALICVALFVTILEIISKTIDLRREHKQFLLRDKLFFSVPHPTKRARKSYHVY